MVRFQENVNLWSGMVEWLGDAEPVDGEIVYCLNKLLFKGRPVVGRVDFSDDGLSARITILGDVKYGSGGKLALIKAEKNARNGLLYDLRFESYVFPRTKLADLLIRRLMEVYEAKDAVTAEMTAIKTFFKSTLESYISEKKP